MRFTLKQIEYFVAAAEAGSITLAAQLINISQPSISAAIAHLEDVFSLPLFLRHHAQGLSLTKDGRRFLEEARRLLMQARALDDAAEQLAEHLTGPLAIGCMTTIYPLLVPDLLAGFNTRHPGITLTVVSGHHGELLDMLRRGEVAASFCYDLDVPPDLDFRSLAPLPPYALLAADHPFARRRRIALRDLAENDPFLLLDLPISRDYFQAMLDEAGVKPSVAGRYQNLDVVRSLVARGAGFSLLNARPRNKAALDGTPLAYVPLSDRARPLRYGLAHLAGLRRTARATAFHSFCETLLDGAPLPGTD